MAASIRFPRDTTCVDPQRSPSSFRAHGRCSSDRGSRWKGLMVSSSPVAHTHLTPPFLPARLRSCSGPVGGWDWGSGQRVSNRSPPLAGVRTKVRMSGVRPPSPSRRPPACGLSSSLRQALHRFPVFSQFWPTPLRKSVPTRSLRVLRGTSVSDFAFSLLRAFAFSNSRGLPCAPPGPRLSVTSALWGITTLVKEAGDEAGDDGDGHAGGVRSGGRGGGWLCGARAEPGGAAGGRGGGVRGADADPGAG